MPALERDPSLRRVRRDSAIICAVAAAVALVLRRGRPDGALGVLAGAALMGISWWAISSGVTALAGKAAAAGEASPAVTRSRGRVALTLAGFVGRWVVLGVAAWAALVPLGAHPLGLFAGVTVTVAAIAVEAVRLAAGSGRAR